MATAIVEQTPASTSKGGVFKRITTKIRSSPSTTPPPAASSTKPKRKPTITLPSLPSLPKPQVAASTLPNGYISADRRAAALRARGLAPAPPMSEQEAEMDRRFSVLVPQVSRSSGEDDAHGSGSEGGYDSEARKIMEAYLRKSSHEQEEDAKVKSGEGAKADAQEEETTAIVKIDAGQAPPFTSAASPTQVEPKDVPLPPTPSKSVRSTRSASQSKAKEKEVLENWTQAQASLPASPATPRSAKEKGKQRLVDEGAEGTLGDDADANLAAPNTSMPLLAAVSSEAETSGSHTNASTTTNGHTSGRKDDEQEQSTETRLAPIPISSTSASITATSPISPAAGTPSSSSTTPTPTPIPISAVSAAGGVDDQILSSSSPSSATPIEEPRSPIPTLSISPPPAPSPIERGRSAASEALSTTYNRMPALSPTRTSSSCTTSESMSPHTPVSPNPLSPGATRIRKGSATSGESDGERDVAVVGLGIGNIKVKEDMTSVSAVLVESPTEREFMIEASRPLSSLPEETAEEQQAAVERKKTGLFSRKGKTDNKPPPVARPSRSIGNLRRSVTGSFTSKFGLRSKTALVVDTSVANSAPSSRRPTISTSASAPANRLTHSENVSVNGDADADATGSPTSSRGGAVPSQSMPSVRPRQALSPTMYSRGSLLMHTNVIEDEESRRLSEAAFLDF